MSVEGGLNADFLDLLDAFDTARVEYLVVGAHAMAVHGVVRATGDLDVWVRCSLDNAARVVAALRSFGVPLAQHGVDERDFSRLGTAYQMGLPPRRIDVLTQVSGVDFDEAWRTRKTAVLARGPVAFLGRAALIQNKLAAARPKDLVDVALLERQEQ